MKITSTTSISYLFQYYSMNITLIGMSGVGKSRIGKELSKELKCNFIDVDEIIERIRGKKLQEIIDELGDENFLKIEEEAILSIGRIDDSVIAPGGSSVYSEIAMDFLKSISKIVFLNATLDEIKRRTPDFSNRGIVGLKEKGLENLFEERQPLYRKYADITLSLPKELDEKLIVERIVKNLV